MSGSGREGSRAGWRALGITMFSSSLIFYHLLANAISIYHAGVFSISILYQISDSLLIAIIKKEAQMHSKGSLCCFSDAFFIRVYVWLKTS